MLNDKQCLSASPEDIVRYAHARNLQAIVYDGFAGVPLKVTFLNDRWWVTSPGEPLVPLEDYFGGEDIGFMFLCNAEDKVGALALAKMLGKALANPEDVVSKVLRQRVEQLKRLGATLDVKDEPLVLELEVFANKGKSSRQGKYSMWCHLEGYFCEGLFDIDAFDSMQDAEQWAGYYFDFLRELGIEIITSNR